MPELPDVENYRIMLAEHLSGKRVRDVRVLDSGVLRNATACAFRARLLGRTFTHTSRRGKWLLAATDDPVLLVHHGMTGRLYLSRPGDGQADDPNDRLIIRTDSVELHYADLRKLRGLWVVDSDAEAAMVIGEQGPDALDISGSQFAAVLRGRRTALKAALIDQQVIAGLGNMLSDEICWRARLHPARPVSSLDDAEVKRLHRVMRMTLRTAVARGRIPRTPTWLSSTRGDEHAACPRCRMTLNRDTINGRTSIWCPTCQPSPLG